MIEWLKAFRPPEWPYWTNGDRAAYVVSLVCFLTLIYFGAGALKDKLAIWF